MAIISSANVTTRYPSFDVIFPRNAPFDIFELKNIDKPAQTEMAKHGAKSAAIKTNEADNDESGRTSGDLRWVIATTQKQSR